MGSEGPCVEFCWAVSTLTLEVESPTSIADFPRVEAIVAANADQSGTALTITYTQGPKALLPSVRIYVREMTEGGTPKSRRGFQVDLYLQGGIDLTLFGTWLASCLGKERAPCSRPAPPRRRPALPGVPQ